MAASPGRFSAHLLRTASLHVYRRIAEPDGISTLADSHDMPFSSLPTEMVCKILVAANLTSPFCLPDPRSVPLTVTLVCGWLRNIAIACQPLWTFYVVDGPQLLRNGHLYLTRAGNFTVHILAPCVFSPPNPEVYSILTRHRVSRPSSL